MTWRSLPFLRLLLPYVAGLVIAPYFPDAFRIWMFLLFALALLPVLLKGRWPYQFRWMPGAAFSLLLLLIGCFRIFISNDSLRSNYFGATATPIPAVLAQICDTKTKGKLLEWTLEVRGVRDTSNQNWILKQGKLQAMMPAFAEADSFQSSDWVILKDIFPQDISAVSNPYAFDYRKWLERQSIYRQVWLDSAQIRSAPPMPPTWRDHIGQWRQVLLHRLHTHLPTDNEWAVGAALILGYRTDMQASVKTTYQETGAMHVLAVSGLHVGLIYALLVWLLQRLPGHWKGRRWTEASLLLAGIWLSPLLTGASPSATRAATMFSCFAVGMAIQRNGNVYNTLSASALVLLLIQPQWLQEVGFQLSYAAMLGIVYFQPRIFRLWYIRHRFGRYLWQLAAVAIGAQLTTFPLTLYYFHQFPTYFLLSGWVVVPAAAAILVLGLLCSLLGGWPALILGKLLYGLISLVNTVLGWIQTLPGHLFREVAFDAMDLILVYSALAALVAGVEWRQFRWISISLGSLMVLACKTGLPQFSEAHAPELVVYHSNRNSLIDLYTPAGNISWQSEALPADQIDKIAGPYRRETYRQQVLSQPLAPGLWQVEGFRLLIIDRPLDWQSPIQVDYAVVCGNAPVQPDVLQAQVQAKEYCWDGSNSRSKSIKIQETAASAEIPIWNTALQGGRVYAVSKRETSTRSGSRAWAANQ